MSIERKAMEQDRKKFYSLIIIAIVLFVVAFSLSVNVPPQQLEQYSFNGGDLSITPSVLYVHNFLWYSPSAFASVTLKSVQSVVQVSVTEVNSTHLSVFNRTFHNVSYFSFYFGLHPNKSFQTENFFVTIGSQIITVSIAIKSSPLPLIGELSLLSSFILFLTGIYLAPFKSRLWIIPIAVSFLVLSAFLGHRFDMFFMITGGFHILSGANPFIQSHNIPGELKWTYTPYYLIWSVIADWLSGAITHTAIPTSHSLIFPGLSFNYYEAWLAFVPRSLPVYYLLAKLPMVTSVVAIYYILLKKFNLPYNLTKIWLLSPFVMLIGVVWGQLDIIASVFLLLSVFYFQKGRSDLAVLASVLGFWIKIFPIFIFPLILIESKNRIRDLGIAVLSSLPALLIYFYTGNFVKDLETLVYSRSTNTFGGVFNAQGLTWQIIVSKLGIVHFPSVFLYTFLPFLVIISIVYYLRRGNIVNYLIVEFMFFFLTYNFVDPQYFIVLIPLFLINRDLWNYVVFSVYPFLFILLTYSFTYFIVPSLSLGYFASSLGQQEALRTWITASNLFILPLVTAFTLSVITTILMVVRKREFRFVRRAIFAR